MIRTAPPPQTAPRKNSGEKFAVRIAEGGNDGGGPGGAEAPPSPSAATRKVLGLAINIFRFFLANQFFLPYPNLIISFLRPSINFATWRV